MSTRHRSPVSAFKVIFFLSADLPVTVNRQGSLLQVAQPEDVPYS